jgi:hypothetical protein
MKSIILTLTITFFSIVAISQKDTVRLKRTAFENKRIVTDRAPQAVYFLFGGSAPVVSVNYDRRFAKRVDGFGFAAGLGFAGGTGASVFSIPVSLNYLFGRKSDFIEVAGGTTFISSSVDNIFDGSSNKGSEFFQHLNAGYRHQPASGGFFFRGGISPLFFSGAYFTSYYVGFGYNF